MKEKDFDIYTFRENLANIKEREILEVTLMENMEDFVKGEIDAHSTHIGCHVSENRALYPKMFYLFIPYEKNTPRHNDIRHLHMKVRDLKISESINLKGAKEFNHLRILNLDDFLSNYNNNVDYYESPFKILADLEQQVRFQNYPEKTILCSYKPGGDIIFDLVEVKEEGNLRIVVYQYSTSIS